MTLAARVDRPAVDVNPPLGHLLEPALADVLLFGGSFDPIHHGHLIVARAVAETLGVQRVILIPAARPPHKSQQALTAPRDRLEMCRLAVEGDPRFEVSDWELNQSGPNYTLHTVQHFRERRGEEISLYWLIGMDGLRELGTWHRVGELAEACTLVTALRPGFELPDLSYLRERLTPPQVETIAKHVLETPLIAIAATDIRARVRAGSGIRYLVPSAVAEYISGRKLYTDK